MLSPIITLAPLAARAAAGNGDWIDLLGIAIANGWSLQDLQRILRVQINVTAISGSATPGLSGVFIEDSIDGVAANANSVGATSAAIVATGRTILTLGPRGDAYPANTAWPFNFSRCRARWTVQGTGPSVTFSVIGVLL